VLVLFGGWIMHRVYLFQTSADFGASCKGRPADLLPGIIFAVLFYRLEDYIQGKFSPWIANDFLRLDRYTNL